MTRRKKWLALTSIVLAWFLISTVGFAQELDLLFDQAEYKEIYQLLGESAGLNVLVDSSVQGRASFQLKEVSWDEALDLISQHGGHTYRLEGKTLLVASEERLQGIKEKNVRYVQTELIPAQEALEALALIMPAGDVYILPEGNLVVLQGSEKTLDQAEELIQTLDRSLAATAVPKKDSSLLEVFKDLSAELGLDLIADPSLETKRLYLDLKNGDPLEVIKQIQQLVPLQVEMGAHSLLVGDLQEQRGERIKVYGLNYAQPETAAEALASLIPEESIKIDKERKSIIVRGTDLQLAEIDLFLADFDQPLPQVVLELWVQEMSTDAMRNLGIDLTGTPSFSGGDAPVFFELNWEPWELILALKILEEKGEAKLLANPKIATLSGREASIFVGDKVPVILKDEEGNQRIETLEAGINLKVTPRISEDRYITILVKPEVSTFIWKTESQYPQVRTREVETNIRVKDGQPIILGGLLQEQEDENISRIPFLSQLPILGKLFQWKETKRTQTEMTIFLIPKIVDEEKGIVDEGFFTPAQ
ncbi:MAG: hypothetical protein GX335_00690 [Firmicutes bacterium]|nr:hypothetical protein [Bacillota bacterium]